MSEEINSSNCTHNCNTCGASCGQRDANPFSIPTNPRSNVEHVTGIVSGKGGVGKSLVTSLFGVASARMGYSTAILDADITGPSIPEMFGVHEKIMGDEDGSMLPSETASGVKLMSVNLILDHETDPVAWRGPVISGVVKQFWSDVAWGKVDHMFVDMPPGTGDVLLTVFQSLPLNGIVVVTSPQELVTVIVEKAMRLAEKMNVPILGIVENMSYVPCPHCGEKINVFGESHVEKICEKYGIPLITRIPILPEIAGMADSGSIESVSDSIIEDIGASLRKDEK